MVRYAINCTNNWFLLTICLYVFIRHTKALIAFSIIKELPRENFIMDILYFISFSILKSKNILFRLSIEIENLNSYTQHKVDLEVYIHYMNILLLFLHDYVMFAILQSKFPELI